ncbi:hypothetical protein BHM03_00008155 [Ensete ventricosum]|nr:hypothetical protein BHM03_00008155 [Ensete ventricosum]
MRPAFKFAGQAFAGSGPCAPARPPRGLLGTEFELVRMSDDSKLGLEGRLLEWWSPGEEGVIQFGSAANSCKEVGSGRLYEHWRPPVYPVGYLRRVGHVGGPAVRGCDDLAARSAFVISFFPPREDLLEAPDEGVEDEVLHLTVVRDCPELVPNADFGDFEWCGG